MPTIRLKRGTRSQILSGSFLEGEPLFSTDTMELILQGVSSKVILARADLDNVENVAILNKIKEVDGTGSGLDADTVDGFHASQTPTANQIPVLDSNGILNLSYGANLAISLGKVGIGISSPSQKLSVSGRIQIGDDNELSVAGTVRWTGTDFEGYTGSEWASFTTSGITPSPLEEVIKASGATLSDSEVRNTIINNYGQTSHIIYTLPVAAAGMNFTIIIGSGGESSDSSLSNIGKALRIEPDSSNSIYFNNVDAGRGTNVGAPLAIKGSQIKFTSFKTGSSNWNWLAVTKGLGWDVCVNVWSITSSLNQAKNQLAGCGDMNVALSFGGNTGSTVNTTEKWSGSSWVTTSALNQARGYLAGCGNVNNALSFGGWNGASYLSTTEKWSGSSWATTTALNQARSNLAGCGNVNNALSFGGWNGIAVNTTEKWSGSSWTITSSLNRARTELTGCGDINNALSFGGWNGTSYFNTTERWSSTSWATTSVLNQAKSGLAGCGNVDNALSFGGYTGSTVNTTEKWSGSSWVITSVLNQARTEFTGCGDVNTALSFGGLGNTSYLNITEKWSPFTPNFVTAWRTASRMNQARSSLAGCGDVNNALSFGGWNGIAVNTTEKWSGSSWITTTVLNITRVALTGCGNVNNALSFGGETGVGSRVNTTEKWSGSSWATTSVLSQVKSQLAGCGDMNTALCIGGTPAGGAVTGTTEKWSGSSWATTSSLNQARCALAGCGNVNSALSFAGWDGTNYFETTERWSGSSWATTSTLNQVKRDLAGCGNVNNALCFGGWNNTSYFNTTERWSGSSWATTSSLNQARCGLAGCGNVNNALGFGGSTGNYVGTTEKWSGV